MITIRLVVSALSLVLAAGIVDPATALASPIEGSSRTDQYLCGQTSHFLYDDGSGTPQLGTISSTFELQSVLISAFAGKKGYDYYKAKSDMNAAGLQNNPYFHQNANAGTMPSMRYVVVYPINDPPVSAADAGLYVGDGATGHFDLWDGMTLRVQFLNDAQQVMLSYVAEGRITLTSTGNGTALEPGVTNTYTFSTAGGPLKWMAPESLGARANDQPSDTLSLGDITFTTTLLPTPGAGGLLVMGLLAAGRRRR